MNITPGRGVFDFRARTGAKRDWDEESNSLFALWYDRLSMLHISLRFNLTKLYAKVRTQSHPVHA